MSQPKQPHPKSKRAARVRAPLTAHARRRAEFDREMAEMAADPQIRAENEAIHREFEGTLADGLPPA